MYYYTVADEDVAPSCNLGLLIYHKGRLIQRYKTSLGKIFCDKFFRNKYKKTHKALFKEIGVIEVNPTLITCN